MSDYWDCRANLWYYNQVYEWVVQCYPDGGRLLDVGGGVSMGAEFLRRFEKFDCTCVDLPGSGDYQLDGVRLICEDFARWELDQHYDVVLCLQVLEHIPDVVPFARKLFSCGETVVLSVPYRWPDGSCSEHFHDPVDAGMLARWTGRRPTRSRHNQRRLVAIYRREDFPSD